MKWIPNTVGTHHAFDCEENRRSRTNGVSNVYDTHEPALSLLYNPWHNCSSFQLLFCYDSFVYLLLVFYSKRISKGGKLASKTETVV